MASFLPQTAVSVNQFWTYVDSAHLLWLEAMKFFGLECPTISGEFMLVNELQYNDRRKSVSF